MPHVFGLDFDFNFGPPASFNIPDTLVSHGSTSSHYPPIPSAVSHHRSSVPPPPVTAVIPSNHPPLTHELVNTEVLAAPPQAIALDEPESTLILPEPQAPSKEKRALNGFMVYRRARHREAEAASGGKMNFAQGIELSRTAGAAWRALTAAEQDVWRARAVEETRILREQENAQATAGGKRTRTRTRRTRKAGQKDDTGNSKCPGKGKGQSPREGTSAGPLGVEEAVSTSAGPDAEGRPAKRQRRTQSSKAAPSTAGKPVYELIETAEQKQLPYSRIAAVTASGYSLYGGSRHTDRTRTGGAVNTYSSSPSFHSVLAGLGLPEGVTPQDLGNTLHTSPLPNDSPLISHFTNDQVQLAYNPMVYAEQPSSHSWSSPSAPVYEHQWTGNDGLYDIELASYHQTSYWDLAYLSG